MPGLPDYLAMPMPALGLHGLPPLPDPRVLGQLTTLGLDAQVCRWLCRTREDRDVKGLCQQGMMLGPSQMLVHWQHCSRWSLATL